MEIRESSRWRVSDNPHATFKDEDADLLHAFAAWAPTAERPGCDIAGPLVKASLELDQPIGEVLRRARALTPAGWSAPGIDLAGLSGYTSTAADAILLSRDLDGEGPWIEGELPPSHLVAVSETLGSPLGEILALCDHLAMLGVRVAGRDRYPRDISTEEAEALGLISSPGQPLSLLQLVLLAGRSAVSVGSAHRKLARLEKRGMLIRPACDQRADFVPSATNVSLIEEHLSVAHSGGSSRFSLIEKPCLQITAILAGRRVGGSSKYLSSGRALIPFTSPDGPITYAELAELSYYIHGTLGEARSALLELYPDAEVPSLGEDDKELTEKSEPYSSLTGELRGQTGVSWLLSPADIVANAWDERMPVGDYLTLLEPFRKIGAPVPACDDRIRAELNRVTLDEYDLDMLTVFDKFGEETSLQTVTALSLVQIAGRLGWTLAHAHRRLSRLTPLGLTLDYPAGELPDEIVRWQDLLLLTTYFDGQPPAITGTISPAYLEKAAAEIFGDPPQKIAEHASWLRGRLNLYTPLFQLGLPGEDADD